MEDAENRVEAPLRIESPITVEKPHHETARGQHVGVHCLADEAWPCSAVSVLSRTTIAESEIADHHVHMQSHRPTRAWCSWRASSGRC
jgi:hypothetical protein